MSQKDLFSGKAFISNPSQQLKWNKNSTIQNVVKGIEKSDNKLTSQKIQ